MRNFVPLFVLSILTFAARAEESDTEILATVLEKLLPLQYQIEGHINTFEEELDALVERANKDPKFRAPPLTGDTYLKIRTAEMAAARLEDELTALYFRSGETSRKNFESALSALPTEDRLQLHSLFTSLPLKHLLPKNVEEAAKEVRELTKKRAEQASNVRIPEFEQEYNSYVSIPFTGKGPIAPSPGAEGTVLGEEFPDGVWALTFDDGPSPDNSLPLMKALGDHRDPAHPRGAGGTFFWLATGISRWPDVVKQALTTRFSLNCHSWNHAQLSYSSQATLDREITEAVTSARKTFNRPTRFYRCPYGVCDAPRTTRARDMIAKLKLVHAEWNLDSLDWKLQDGARSFELVKKQMQITKRGIILMHDIHSYSLKATRLLLAWIKTENEKNKEKIRLMNLEEAVDLANRTPRS